MHGRSFRLRLSLIAAAAVLLALAAVTVRAGPGTTNAQSASAPPPPAQALKLVFVHHSCGENWLADDDGGLGLALRDNNYFVSDTNYGWGPDGIGDHTDIGHWWTWFRGPGSAIATRRRSIPSIGQNATYTRRGHRPRRREPDHPVQVLLSQLAARRKPDGPAHDGSQPAARAGFRLIAHDGGQRQGHLQRSAALLRRAPGQAVRGHHRAAAGNRLQPTPQARPTPGPSTTGW